MPAVMRGGTRRADKPRAPASKARSGRSGPSARASATGPAKIRAARRIGLRPGAALAVAGVVVVVGLLAALVAGGRWRPVESSLAAGASQRLAALGFRVVSVQLEGVSAVARSDVLRAAGLHRDAPILGLDLAALRGRVERVGWVKSARVVRLLPDTLVIAVSERTPTAVWQHGGRTLVVDDAGQGIPEADPVRFSDLPLVVGQGANQSASEILPLLRVRPKLMAETEALVRVDERRWDIRLKDGGLIQLPATGEDSALIQLDQLDQKARILDLGFARIDLRDPELVAVRPKDGGAPAPAPAAAGA